MKGSLEIGTTLIYLPVGLRKFFSEHAQAFKRSGSGLPEVWSHLPSQSKACFENAATAALAYPGELTYVEGYAVSGNLPLPLPHAWLIDSTGEVIDPTWEEGSDYLGIPFAAEELSEILLLLGQYGIIDSLWRSKEVRERLGIRSFQDSF